MATNESHNSRQDTDLHSSLNMVHQDKRKTFGQKRSNEKSPIVAAQNVGTPRRLKSPRIANEADARATPDFAPVSCRAECSNNAGPDFGRAVALAEKRTIFSGLCLASHGCSVSEGAKQDQRVDTCSLISDDGISGMSHIPHLGSKMPVTHFGSVERSSSASQPEQRPTQYSSQVGSTHHAVYSAIPPYSTQDHEWHGPSLANNGASDDNRYHGMTTLANSNIRFPPNAPLTPHNDARSYTESRGVSSRRAPAQFGLDTWPSNNSACEAAQYPLQAHHLHTQANPTYVRSSMQSSNHLVTSPSYPHTSPAAFEDTIPPPWAPLSQSSLDAQGAVRFQARSSGDQFVTTPSPNVNEIRATLSDASSHQSIESDLPFSRCNECNTIVSEAVLETDRRSNVRRHIRDHHRGNARPTCLEPGCQGRTFARSDLLLRHQRNVHRSEPPTRPTGRRRRNTQSSGTDQRRR